MRHLPNIITTLRIAGSIGLLLCNVTGWSFWTLYAICGFSDMIDGWLARKLHVESKTGSVLDSIVFLTVPTISWCIIPIAIVAIIATFAAIQEGNYIGTRREII